MERATKTLTTSSGYEIVYREYITAGEKRRILEEAQAADTPTAKSFLFDDKSLETAIVTIDGSVEKIAERALSLPVKDFQEIMELVSEMIAPKKNSEKT